MRTTLTTAALGALMALVVVGGFLALDRTTLHWYVTEDNAPPATPASETITATEAETRAIQRIRESEAWTAGSGRIPFCDATDRIEEGWLVQCGVKNIDSGREFRQLGTFLVSDNGLVTNFP